MTRPGYVSQWASPELAGRILDGSLAARDDPRWAESGARTPAEYEFWSWRACGLACLSMVLGTSGPGVVARAVEAESHGAFVIDGDTVHGLLYRPFARWVADDFGLTVEVVEHDTVDALARRVGPGRPFIASVHPSIRDAAAAHHPPHTGGHLVLVHAADDGRLTLHNPSGDRAETQADVVVDAALFARYYAGRGMQVLGRVR